MSEKLILAIDQGTTNTKAIIIDTEGKVVTRASVPMDITFPQPAWVEQDPTAILESVKRVVEVCLAHISPRQPTVLGISNHRETGTAWDRSPGTPLGPAVVWQ